MKYVTIDHTWKATTQIELSDEDYDMLMENLDNFCSWPDSVVDELDTNGAYLADWEVH